MNGTLMDYFTTAALYDYDLRDPDGRAQTYGLLVAHMLSKPAPHKQLTRHAYPGQPSHRAEHVIQPCVCRYRTAALEYRGFTVVVTTRAFPPYPVLKTMLDTGVWRATWFEIQPHCPHHGHLANTHLIERLWSDPYLNGILRDPYDMDDDERRSP